MGLLQFMRSPGEKRRGERMQDGESEHDAGRQQEAVLPDGLRELRPEIGVVGMPRPKAVPSPLAISSAD